MIGSDAKAVDGKPEFAATAKRMIMQKNNLNGGFIIHLPSQPERQIIDHWKNIFAVAL
jgi:hypothetical protein